MFHYQILISILLHADSFHSVFILLLDFWHSCKYPWLIFVV